jgi:hypothetical protein
MTENGMRCIQSVTVIGPPPELEKIDFDFQLSKQAVDSIGECWLIDAVSLSQ